MNYEAVLRHIGVVHSWEPDFKISCGINGCPKVYASYRSYRKHIIKKHQELLVDEFTVEQNGTNNITVVENDINNTMVVEECSDSNIDESGSPDPLHNKAAFLLKLKEERRVSQKAINGIVDDMNTLFEEELAALKTEVTSCFASNQGTVETVRRVKEVFEQKASVPFFHCLSSEHLRKAYYTTHFSYVVSFKQYLLVTNKLYYLFCIYYYSKYNMYSGPCMGYIRTFLCCCI